MPRDFFVTLTAPGEQPVAGGATHLQDWLYAVARERARGGDSADEARAWRWDDSGQLTPLTIRQRRVGEFDANDYADQTWEVGVLAETWGVPETVYAYVVVRIDGRA